MRGRSEETSYEHNKLKCLEIRYSNAIKKNNFEFLFICLFCMASVSSITSKMGSWNWHLEVGTLWNLGPMKNALGYTYKARDLQIVFVVDNS